jgi:hypothetical protein
VVAVEGWVGSVMFIYGKLCTLPDKTRSKNVVASFVLLLDWREAHTHKQSAQQLLELKQTHRRKKHIQRLKKAKI